MGSFRVERELAGLQTSTAFIERIDVGEGLPDTLGNVMIVMKEAGKVR